MSEEYIIDKLKRRTSGKTFYPETLLEAIKGSDDENSKNLYQILSNVNIPTNYELYGYQINKNDSNPQTRISYYAMAGGKRPAFWNYTNGYFDVGDWGNAFFLKNMFPCMVKYDGTIDYKLDPENYNLKEDGTTSDVANVEYEGSAMVAFPNIWTKRWEDDNYEYCSICNIQLDSDFHDYMHTRADGSIARYKYIGMYLSNLYDTKYKSLAGVAIPNTYTAEQEYTYTHNIGENFEVFSFSDFSTIGDLLRLISKSDNTRFSYGYGYNGSTSNTDAGTIRYGGSFYNSAAVNASSWRKILHLHFLYDNYITRISGIIYKDNKIYIKPYPPYNFTAENYTDTGVTLTGTSGQYSYKTKMTEYGRIPVALGGSTSTYGCDLVFYTANITAIGTTLGYSTTSTGGANSLSLAWAATQIGSISNRISCFSVDSTDGQENISASNESAT